MENFKEFEPDHDVIEGNELFKTVLLDPKRAFKFIHKYEYENHVKVLLVLAGISGTFDRAVNNNSGDDMSLGGVIAMSVIVGGLLGWISYYLYAALMSWTGGWLNGNAGTSDLLRIIAYANIPSILGLIIMIFQLILVGNSYFQSTIYLDEYGTAVTILYYGLAIAQLGLGIWNVFLLVIGVAEAQQFGYGKAFLNVILPIIVIVVPIALLVLLFL
ncbi:Yip1 family protein [Flavobacterium sp.]|uniref:Yip1 family protein n=1 Tax=Flavobacterium sp. TaxID=239 RepID=UPI002B4B4E43|nr:Yip1 family protein [Flavobacterium sp.]HLP64761.1 Yip1 family protein [Flavobacterium sp.]